MNTALLSRPPAGPAAAAGGECPGAILLRAPLLDPSAARLALQCPERRLMQWVLSGDLEWAFDLRRAGVSRACLRILTESVARLQQRGRPVTPREKAAQRQRPLEKVFDPLFHHHKPVLFISELGRVWACSVGHIHNLVEDGLLGVVEKDYLAREAVQISRESAFQFMQSRRIL
jgi:hypothetical protein